METKWIAFSTVLMMFTKENFCGIEIEIESKDEEKEDKVKIEKRKDEMMFTFKNGEVYQIPFDKGMEKLKKIKELLKEKNILRCYIYHNYIFVSLKDNFKR